VFLCDREECRVGVGERELIERESLDREYAERDEIDERDADRRREAPLERLEMLRLEDDLERERLDCERRDERELERERERFFDFRDDFVCFDFCRDLALREFAAAAPLFLLELWWSSSGGAPQSSLPSMLIDRVFGGFAGDEAFEAEALEFELDGCADGACCGCGCTSRLPYSEFCGCT